MAKTTRKSTKTNGTQTVPELNPRDLDQKYYGSEPSFPVQPGNGNRGVAVIKGLNWYNRFYDRKTAKEQFAPYADYHGDGALAKKLRKAEDSQINPSVVWMARMSLRGLQLTEVESTTIKADLDRLAASVDRAKPAEDKPVKEAARTNVQEIMRERTLDAGGELEAMLDDYIQDGAKTGVQPQVVNILTERNILPQHIPMLTAAWKRKLEEFAAVAAKDDPQLVEAYSHFTKTQMKALVKYSEAVLAGLESYISVKKAQKAPRKRKAVTPEKQVSKLKYLKQFQQLGLTGVSPTKIIGATEVWAYDTAKRKLHYYVADSHVGSLGVKGSTILGFDNTKSGIKTIRKPEDVLKKLVAAGKPASRKLFDEIKAVQAKPNGRTNEALLFLKVY